MHSWSVVLVVGLGSKKFSGTMVLSPVTLAEAERVFVKAKPLDKFSERSSQSQRCIWEGAVTTGVRDLPKYVIRASLHTSFGRPQIRPSIGHPEMHPWCVPKYVVWASPNT